MLPARRQPWAHVMKQSPFLSLFKTELCVCGLFSFHRNNVGQGGVPVCRGSGAGSGLRAARAASHGSHHHRLPGRVCPQDLGDMAEEERGLGKKCCLSELVSVCPHQKISQFMKALCFHLCSFMQKKAV